MSKDRDFKSLAYYYIRRGWYGQLATACENKGKDALGISTFWKAFSLGASGHISESIRLLSSFQARPDMQYPVSLALSHFHQKAPVVDHEMVASLRSSLSATEDVAKEVGLVLAARFSLIVGDCSTASRLCTKILAKTKDPSTPGELEAMAISHWIYIFNAMLDKESQSDLIQIERFIRQKSSILDVDLDSLMAWNAAKQLLGDKEGALNVLNQIIAAYNNFMPAYAEKCLLMASMTFASSMTGSSNWVDVLDLATKLSEDFDAMDGKLVIAIHDLTQDMHIHFAIEKVTLLVSYISMKEPSNAVVQFEIATLLSRLCCRQPRALSICANLLQSCVQTTPNNSMYLCELGYVHVLQCQYAQALKWYREASKKDANNIKAIEGMVLCQILQGEYDDAEAQIELLSLMGSGSGDQDLSAELAYIRSILATHATAQHGKDPSQQIDLLMSCKARLYDDYKLLVRGQFGTETLMTNGGNIYGIGHCLRNELIALNPDLLFQVAMGCLTFVEPVSAMQVKLHPTTTVSGISARNTQGDKITGGGSQAMRPIVKGGLDILGDIISRFPSFLPAYIEMSRCYLAIGRHDQSMAVMNQYLSHFNNENDLPAECSVVLLMKARTEIARGNTSLAERLLEQSLSNDFSIRSQSLYKLIQAMLYAQLPVKYEEALQVIEQLISNSPQEFRYLGGNVSGSEQSNRSHSETSNPMRITDDDRVTAYITHASILSKLKRQKEATKVLAEAKVMFSASGNPYQEVTILVASAQLHIDRNDFDAAIRTLDKISTDNILFGKVQMIKAEILLTNQRDREGFIQCYKLLLEKAESEANNSDPAAGKLMVSQAYSQLGDAYLRVLNPEAAVGNFEAAYRLDYQNVYLRVKIGKALVATHEYHRAVDFYEAALRDINKQQMKPPTTQGSSISAEAVVLSHDLARLYLKLGRHEPANRVLVKVLHDESLLQSIEAASAPSGDSTMGFLSRKGRDVSIGGSSVDSAEKKQDDVKTLMLMLKVVEAIAELEEGVNGDPNAPRLKANGEMDRVIPVLRVLHKLQQEVLMLVRSHATSATGMTDNTTVETEKQQLSSFCVLLGDTLMKRIMSSPHSHSAAAAQGMKEVETFLEEAIQHNPENLAAMLSIAKLYRARDELFKCAQQCRKIVRFSDNDNEDAVVMLAECMLLMHQQQMQQQWDSSESKGSPSRKDNQSAPTVLGEKEVDAKDTDAIVHPLKEHLIKHPDSFKVLEKFIQMQRKIGNLQIIPKCFQAAEKYNKRSVAMSGFHYCKGLYYRYTNDIIQAINHFNLSRKDRKTPAYAENSLVHMIELYLNPDQDGIWSTALDDASGSSRESNSGRSAMALSDATVENIRVAEVLLEELRPICSDPRRYQVLESYCMFATRQRNKVDAAMQRFIEMVEEDPDYLPGILGMATGFMMEKNAHKARNLLKRVVKMDILKHDGEDFEKANLLLAKFSSDKTKNDVQTQELCKKCLSNNKSCSLAWDILGTSYERDTDYLHACECYEKAWKLEFEASAPMGFKYAYCLMKNKQFVESIDVCEKVLAMYPDYPRIKEEILKKCQMGIRSF